MIGEDASAYRLRRLRGPPSGDGPELRRGAARHAPLPEGHDPGLGTPDQDPDSEVAFGAAFGFDIGFSKTFAITGGARWLSLDLATDMEDVGVDPLIARAGVAFRFGTR